ncbi:MAG: 50S ribosomal protein L29 [Candidatus Micrarchaeia archaeon]
MKVKDIKNMSNDEMKSKIADLEKELSIEYGTRSSAAGKSRNYGKIRTIKRTIARMKTFIRARELGILGKEANKEKIQNKK